MADRTAGQPQASAARGSVVLLLSFIAVAGFNYAFAITMSYLLPVEEYGLLGVIQTILLFGSTVVGAGFPWALTRTIAASDRAEAIASAFQATLLGNVAVGLAIGVLLPLGTWQGWFPFGAQYRVPMLLAGGTIATLAATGVFAAMLQGLLRFGQLGLTRIAEVVVKFGAGILLTLAGYGIDGAIGAFLGAALLSTLVAALSLRGVPLWRSVGWPGARLRELSRSVGPLFIGQICLAALINVDIIGLKLFSPAGLSDQFAGEYQAAVTLTRIPIYLTMALLNAVFPFISRQAPRSELANSYALLALKYLLLFLVPLDLIFLVIPGPLIRFFFSDAFDASATPMAITAAGTSTLVLVYGLAMLLQAAGQLRVQAWALPVTLAVEIAALYVLVPRLETDGAGLALASAGVCGLVLLLPATLRAYMLRVPPRGAIAYLAALAVFALLLRGFPDGGRFLTICAIIVASGGYALLLVVLGLLRADDVTLLSDGLGPRFAPLARRIGHLVTRLGSLAPRRPDTP
jgi:O-antigen/teichoic acid export membrane protein